ncbi:MAG: HAMP domain-containing sensor histidine kinase [Firmicutes bacterium]|nr:HAMP domain-containing sensor histidine kinase [Bacillota bacterium]
MKSIRFKLWAGMMSLVLVMLVLLWLFQIVFLESFYTPMKIADIKDKAGAITKLLDAGISPDFQNQMDAFAYENNLSIELLDRTGKTTYQTDASGNGVQMPMMNSSRVQVYEQALAGREAAATLTHPRFGNKFMLIGLPVNTMGESAGALIMTFPLAPVADTVSILQWQLFYISLILLAAALLIAFLLARSFTRPIVEIEKAAAKMAGGDFSARIITTHQDEIGQLAQTINYLGQQLSQIDQLRKDLIANVSHELRTPLSLIRGYAETLRDVTGSAPDKREKQLGIIIEESERLSGMVDDILNLSRLQAGNYQLNKNCFGINELVERVAQRYDLLSQQTAVSLRTQLLGEIKVEGDEARIEQVLYNLINNAFQHTSKSGTITIRDIDLTEKIRIEIADNGTGIPEEGIDHIWDRYYQGETTGVEAVGSGLGLAIVKAVLEAHGSAFGVESQEKVGTTFWFELKRAI